MRSTCGRISTPLRNSASRGWTTLPAGTFVAAVAAAWLATFPGVAQEHPIEPHRHEEARVLKNPVPGDAASLVAGKQLYLRFCLGCHGPTGKGDGSMALGVIPSSLVEPTLRHGSSDGEIFAIIRDGATIPECQPNKGRLSDEQMWHVVNYIQSLRPKPTQNP